MAFEMKNGQGSLFHNDKKEKESHPDYTGSIKTPDGQELWLSGWKKEGKDGKKGWLSLSLKPKDAKPARQQTAAGKGFDDSEPDPF